MEIERKFLISGPPADLEDCPHRLIEQGYLCTAPVVRVRRDGETFWLTYKGAGVLAHEEYNLPLTEEAYRHLLEKADGRIIRKTRYLIPLDNGLTIELDHFDEPHHGLYLAEVEFPDVGAAKAFTPPAWLVKDVTDDPAYRNSTMSRGE